MKSKNIILLSGVDTSDNIEALKYIKEKYPKFKRLCYIPAEKLDSKDEIKCAKKDFKKHIKGLIFETAILEDETSKEIKEKIRKADIVFLGGGNTFHFFDNIKKRGLKSALSAHLKTGKLIVGLSAGGIVLTPSLMMACYPSKDADGCHDKREDLRGLNFLPFEVCPHYKSSKHMNKELLVYSSLHNPPLYGVKDGDFIAVGDAGVYFSSRTSLFFHGEKVRFI